MKCLTQQEAILRYGPIDLASRTWPDMPGWMTLYEIPIGKFPNLTIMNTKIKAHHISCNRDILRPLNEAMNLLIDIGLDHELLTYDGCLFIRLVRGSQNEMSAHSYGLALDFNAQTNPLGGPVNMNPPVAQCFTKAGFDWGANFKRVDGMHFSYCWEGQ